MASRKRNVRTADGNAALSLDELDDDSPLSTDLSQCRHGIRDDSDCVDCRSEGCVGGSDCSCGDFHNRKNPVSFPRY